MLKLRWHRDAEPITGEPNPGGALLVDGGIDDDAVLLPHSSDDVEALERILEEVGIDYELQET